MDAPSGMKDLAADTDDEVRRLEQQLAERRAEIAKRNGDGENLALDDDGEIAEADKPKPWPHKFMTFNDVEFEVRVPSSQALIALTIATSKHSSDQDQAEYTALFINNHMSAASRDVLFRRMMDPDDHEFDGEDTMMEIMRRIAAMGTARPTGRSRR